MGRSHFRMYTLYLLLITALLCTACGSKAGLSTQNPGAAAADHKAASNAPTQTVNVPKPGPVVIQSTTGLTGGDTALPEDMQRIVNRGKLIVAMYSQDRPPFFFVDSGGQLRGSDVDLAMDLAAQLGVKAEFNRSAKTFDEVVGMIAQGKADIAVSKLSITLSRAQKVRYSAPYIVLQQALLINRVKLAALKSGEKDIIQVIESTKSKVGVRKGTSYVEYARQFFPNAHVVEYDDNGTMMNDVLAGDILAVFYDENEIKRYILENPERSLYLQISMLSDKEDRLAMAVAPKDVHLLSWVNQYLETNKINYNITKLIQKYSEQARAKP